MASRGLSASMWLVLCILIGSMDRATTFSLTISPERGHIRMGGDNLTVTCQANEPITRCQFNFWKDEAVPEGPLLDLSQGSRTPVDASVLSKSITGYKYSGTGLNTGQCGVRLSLAGWKRYMLGCRVKGEKGGWRYAIMSFTADQSSSTPVTLTPKSVVALPGSNVSLLCQAEGSLDWCRWDSPGGFYKHLFFDKGADSTDSNNEHRYYGAGVARGDCGITYTSVSEGLNGYAFCGTINKPGAWNRIGIPFVVARAPSRPVLEVTSSSLIAGSILEATCTVNGGRPVANVTWYLDNEVILQDDENDSPDDVWRWPTSLQKVTQRLRRRLLASDDGRKLRCEATHIALPRPLADRITISFSTCPPLTSQSVLISCFTVGEEVDCNQPQQAGTEARLACKPGYALPNSVLHRKTTCLKGGTWNHPVFTCHPDCGRRNTNDGVTLIAGGKVSTIGEFPWHIGIYQTLPDFASPQQTCGGSLISPSVVISAAHCFWSSKSERANDASDYKVAAGKHIRLWDDPDLGVQKRNVTKIKLHELYRGRNTGFAYDIAIVRLESSFIINPKVNLICVDWENSLERRPFTIGMVGVVAGWGYTESGVLSDTLKYVDLPFVSSETCLNSLSRPQQALLTPDKFCAGFVNKSTSVCRGDSGGGLVIRDPASDKYYLSGIVSVGFKPFADTSICYSQHYTAFTKFSPFLSWIQDTV